MSCLVDGRLSIRSYETKEGEKRKATEVVVNTMQMLDRAGRGGGDMGDEGGGERSYQRPRAAARQQPGRRRFRRGRQSRGRDTVLVFQGRLEAK